MTNPPSPYLQAPVSNGNPLEQALIRRYWRESLGSAGVLVWEYFLGGYYADAIVFPDISPSGSEAPGRDATKLFPLEGARIIICEAKVDLTPELVGQALVYRQIADDEGAQIEHTFIFAANASARIRRIAEGFGLEPVVNPL